MVTALTADMFIIPFIRGLVQPGSVFHSFLYFSHGDLICDEIPDGLYVDTTYTIGKTFTFVELNKSSNIYQFKEDSEIPPASKTLCWHTLFDFEIGGGSEAAAAASGSGAANGLSDSSPLLRSLDDFYKLLLNGSLLTDAKWCAINKFANTDLSWLDVYCAISGSTSLEFDFADLGLADAANDKFEIYYKFPITRDELDAAITHILMCGFGMGMDFNKNIEYKPGRVVVKGPRPASDCLASVMKDGILGFVPGIKKIRSIVDEKGCVLWERGRVVKMAIK